MSRKQKGCKTTKKNTKLTGYPDYFDESFAEIRSRDHGEKNSA